MGLGQGSSQGSGSGSGCAHHVEHGRVVVQQRREALERGGRSLETPVEVLDLEHVRHLARVRVKVGVRVRLRVRV